MFGQPETAPQAQAAPANGAAPATSPDRMAHVRAARGKSDKKSEEMTVSGAVGRIHGVLRQLSDPQDRVTALNVALSDAKRAIEKAAKKAEPAA